ncbi:MAG: sterol desaturase family protein [Sphingomicrobium sp.]
MEIVTTVAISLSLGLLVCLFPFFVVILIEQIAPIERFSMRDRLPGLVMNVVLVTLGPALVWPLQRLWIWLGVAHSVTIPLWTWLAPLGIAGYALQILFLVALADFLVYWRHRAEHRWFWPIHAVHHVPTELHAANDYGHPGQTIVNLIFVLLPLSLFQFDGPTTPFVVVFIATLMTIYIHSPVDVHFGPLRTLLVDNRFHRIHHSLEERHFDRNFGICFSIWDRMFGTAYDPDPAEWPRVGLAGIDPPRSIVEYLSLPVRVWTQARKLPTGYALATTSAGLDGSLSRDKAAATALASAPTVNGLRSSS